MNVPSPDNIPPELLAERRWVCWRLEPQNPGEKVTKIPYRPDGRGRASSNKPETWGTFHDAATAAELGDYTGIGFVMGDGWAGVDIDDCLDDSGAFTWAADVVVGLDSYAEVSPSKRGVKVFVRTSSAPAKNATAKGQGPDGQGELSVFVHQFFTFTGDALPGVPLNVHDRTAELAEQYAWVLAQPKPAETAPAATSSAEQRAAGAPASSAPADQYLQRCLAAMITSTMNLVDKNDGSSRLYVACCRAVEHGLSQAGIVQAVRLYAKVRPFPKNWSDAEILRRARDAETKGDAVSGVAVDPIAIYGFDAPPAQAAVAGPISDPPLITDPSADADPVDEAPVDAKFPQRLLEPPGFVREITDWINETASRPQPILALANTLAFLGAVVGRKVRSPSGLRTNLYCLGVGETGCGKDHSRQCIKVICDEAGIMPDVLGGEEVSSDTAIVSSLAEHPSLLFQFDEIGHLLAQSNSKNAQTHQRNIAPTFTRLFTSAGTTYLGKAMASKKRVDIVQPNACIYGTTVPSTLYDGLTPAEISDGFLGRLLVFKSDDPSPSRRRVPPKKPSKSIVTMVSEWFNRQPPPPPAELGNINALKHVPIEVPFDAEAAARFDKFDVECQQRKAAEREDGRGLDALWSRAEEHAIKVSLIVACGVDYHDLRITGDVAAWSIDLVTHLTTELVDTVKQHVAANDQERDVQKVETKIRNARKKGLSQSELINATRWLKSSQRDDCLKQLILGTKVFKRERKPARGPAAQVYVHKNYLS